MVEVKALVQFMVADVIIKVGDTAKVSKTIADELVKRNIATILGKKVAEPKTDGNSNASEGKGADDNTDNGTEDVNGKAGVANTEEPTVEERVKAVKKLNVAELDALAIELGIEFEEADNKPEKIAKLIEIIENVQE